MTVSTIIPCYNAAPYVEKAVQSALALPEVREVILVEDNSSDDSLRICQKLADEHEQVRLLRHPDGLNHGAGASRNLGLKAAHYPFISFLDTDDFYLPNRFETTKRIFKQYPELDGVYEAAAYVFHTDEAKNMHAVNEKQLVSMHRDRPPEELFEAFLASPGEWFHLDALTFRKDTLPQIGYFDEQLKQTQDTDWLLRLCLKGNLRAGNIQQPVAMIRRHERNRVLNIEEAQKYRFEMLHKWKERVGSMPISKEAKLHFLKSYLDCHPWVRPFSNKRTMRKILKSLTFGWLLLRFPQMIRLLK